MMKKESKIYNLDYFKPAKSSKTQIFLDALLSVPIVIGIGLSIITLALVPILATIIIGGLIAVVSVIGVIAVLIALAVDQAKQKKRVQ